jgi:hypothetical protein
MRSLSERAVAEEAQRAALAALTQEVAPKQLKAADTSSLRPHTPAAEGRIH